jgi:hypothetical protein
MIPRRRLSLPLLGAALAGLLACTGPDPAVSPVSPGMARPGGAGPMAAAPGRPAPATPGQVFTAPAAPPGQGVREGAALAAACRQDADRIIQFRDRGQLMREDERDARVGTDSSIYARRTETDRLGRLFERDRLAADCVQQNTRAAPQR